MNDKYNSILNITSKAELKKYRLIFKLLYEFGIFSETRYEVKSKYLDVLEKELKEKQKSKTKKR